MKKLSFLISASLIAAACQPVASDAAPASSSDKPFETTVIADFEERQESVAYHFDCRLPPLGM